MNKINHRNMMEVLFVCSGNHGEIHHGTKAQIDSLVEKDIKVEIFLVKGKGALGYLKNLKKIRTFYKKLEPQLIHVIGGHCSLLCAIGLFRKKKVVSFLGSDIQRDSTQKGLKKIFSEILRQAILLFSKSYDQIIVKSKKMAESLPKSVLSKTSVVPNGVDFEFFHLMDKKIARQKLGLKQNLKYILFLGNKNLKNKNYKLARQSLTVLEDEEIKLIAPFPTNYSKIPLYMNSVDVLLLTSFSEGSPNVIKEAMACNCPIVSTDVGDVKENFNQLLGYSISEFNPIEFAEKIKSILRMTKRPDARSKIGHLAKEKIAQKIISIYKRIVDEY